ncbi:FeoA family protein [Pelosinus propionicus]|uniref:Ferrous iron transport protein A n=1 Tax=Pelosinus propionicus DSM 13327 TaxID=1123291 RepID=A0A1I4IK57_9FIRM|nr:FeoA family protein [Pelosinus propionicus]SFL54467.1 ferrous iron transport protein A [Pelosinus propionicus DSM 13327]
MNTAITTIPLSTLGIGSACQIVSLNLQGLLRRRILDLGMVPGTPVQCIRKSPAGDPVAYMVRDTLIALRSEDASQIYVNPM